MADQIADRWPDEAIRREVYAAEEREAEEGARPPSRPARRRRTRTT